MVLFPTWSAVILILFGYHNPEDSVLHRSSTLKKFDSQHMRIFHTGEYQETARQLAIDGDAFLKRIEKDWGVVLPERSFTVSLIRVKPEGIWFNHDFDPPWLFSTYNNEQKRIELRARPEALEYAPLLKALKHHLIHALLNLAPAEPLPPFLEEGLARHYAGSRGSRQVYWAVLGFRYAQPLAPFLNNPYTYTIDLEYQYAAAIGYQFVPWLWAQGPEVERAFLQAHLQGNPLDQALAAAGLPALDNLLPTFEAQVAPEFGLTRLLKTFDFWLLFLSVLAIIAMIFKVIAAYRVARMGFVEIEAQPEAIPAEMFSGPAFQAPDPAPALADPPDLVPVFEPIRPRVTNPATGEADHLTDEIFLPPMDPSIYQQSSVDYAPGLHMDTDEFGNLEDQLNEAFQRFEDSVEPPPQTALNNQPKMGAKKRAKPIGEDTKAGIEAALDQFFEKLPQADLDSGPKNKKPSR